MNNEIIIVNELDKVIGYKSRNEIKTSDIYRVAVLWITNSKGEILLAKRSKTKENSPSKWGTAVAGTVEKGETYYTNLIKEAREEIGLTDTYPVRGEKNRIKSKTNYFRQWHFITINKDIKDFKLNKDEVEKIKWFKKDELLSEIKKKPSDFLDSVKDFMKDNIK